MQTNLERKSSANNVIQNLKTDSADLDKSIMDYRKKVHAQRISMGGAEKTKNYHKVVLRRLEVAEGKLYRELSNFNSILTENEKFRAKLSTLRHEKSKFQHKYEILSQKHIDNKANIANVVQNVQDSRIL